jgi:phosphoglycolate phosphatase
MFRALLFDLDGTLLDTLEDLAGSMNRVLARRGWPVHEADSFRYFVGDGARVLVLRALPEEHRDEASIAACLADFREDYDRNWRVKTQPYAGVAEMLDELERRGLPKAVLSNKPHDFTTRCVSELLPRWRFEPVLGLRDDRAAKPDPGGALEIAGLLGISPEEFLYVGDTSIDMETAQAAGMHPVGVLWGFRPKEELERSGARTLLAHPMELLRWL